MLWSIRQGQQSGVWQGAVAFSEKFRQAGICDPSYQLAAVGRLLVCRCEGLLPGWDCGPCQAALWAHENANPVLGDGSH